MINLLKTEKKGGLMKKKISIVIAVLILLLIINFLFGIIPSINKGILGIFSKKIVSDEAYKMIEGKGSIKITGFWLKKYRDYNLANILVSYKNTTKKTFKQGVILEGIIYDDEGFLINSSEKIFSTDKYGDIKPGFEESILISVEYENIEPERCDVEIVEVE